MFRGSIGLWPKFRRLCYLFPVLLITVLAIMGCGTKENSLSPEAQAFKKEVGGIIHQLQQSLSDLMVKGDIQGINAVLEKFSQKTAGICIDCPYKTAVINQEGILLTTFPNNEFIGRNFSTYKIVSEPVEKRRITQALAYMANSSKIYFISAPLLTNGKTQGVVVLALTPADLEKKWRLTEKEFLNINFNTI